MVKMIKTFVITAEGETKELIATSEYSKLLTIIRLQSFENFSGFSLAEKLKCYT